MTHRRTRRRPGSIHKANRTYFPDSINKENRHEQDHHCDGAYSSHSPTTTAPTSSDVSSTGSPTTPVVEDSPAKMIWLAVAVLIAIAAGTAAWGVFQNAESNLPAPDAPTGPAAPGET